MSNNVSFASILRTKLRHAEAADHSSNNHESLYTTAFPAELLSLSLLKSIEKTHYFKKVSTYKAEPPPLKPEAAKATTASPVKTEDLSYLKIADFSSAQRFSIEYLWGVLDQDTPITLSKSCIKKAFRKVALQIHPDRGHNNHELYEKFIACKQAYDLILEAYDDSLKEAA